MKRSLLLCCVLVPNTLLAQTLELKLGAWEMMYTSSSLPRPMVEKECVTKADLAAFSGGPDKDDDAQCKYTKPPVLNGKTWSAEKACAEGRTVRAEFTAESSERVRGNILATGPKGGKSTAIQISGKWLGTSCKGIE